ncbi:MAG: nickel/cobalt ABC transporter permease [Peptostreptococcaceae bacterium]
MRKYIIKRILNFIPLLLAVSFFTFVFINLIPSDPAEIALRVNQTPIISEELLEKTREQFGLNDPYLVRYFNWLTDALRLDFGISYVNPSQTVSDKIFKALPNTLLLAGFSFFLVVVISVPVGFLCAVYKDSLFDKVTRAFIFITTAIPSYWVGLMLMWIVSVKMGLLPSSGNYNGFKSLILPSVTVALTYISTFIRLIRNNMIENMSEEYVHYANVRGLKQKDILLKHILRNSLHTCIVAVGMSIPQLISGTIVVENVFAWPGLGTLCIEAIFNRDFPVIQTYVLLIGVLFITFNLVFDIIQVVIDPKLRTGGDE